MNSVSGAMVQPKDRGRLEPRTKLFKLARLRTASGDFRAHLLDISPMGARLHCAASLRAGQQVTLEIGGHALAATILRMHEGRAGVRFHVRLGEDVVRQIAG